MDSLINRTFRLRDKENPSSEPFHAIVIGDDEATGVTYVEHGKQAISTPRNVFESMIECETEHLKPYLPLKQVKAEEAPKHASARK